MKKKIVYISTLFLLAISLLIGGFATVELNNSGESNHVKLADSSKKALLTISGDIEINVGEELDFSDKFMLYVKASDKEALTYEVENEEVIYLTQNKNKLIALRAGESKVRIYSDKYETELNVKVILKNFCDDGTFKTLDTGTRWLTSNEEHFGWRLYTGGAVVQSDQIVEVVELEDGNKVIHYNHPNATQYSNLYKSYTVEPGQYYVTAKMKGVGVLKDVYVRVNQGNKFGLTQTTKVKGDFDWTEYQSEIVRVAEGEKLKLEMYFANNAGEVWFDDLAIYRVITTDYTTFTPEKSVEKLEVGSTAQIKCETYPASIVDYQYYYTSENPAVATVDKLGNITAVSNGITNVIVEDSLYGYKKVVMVIVGTENGISGTFNGGNVIKTDEDSTSRWKLDIADSDNYIVAKYTEPVYGNYYIENNEIVYTPKADYYSLSQDKVDTFSVIAFDEEKGYVEIRIVVEIEAVLDDVTTVEFWHTTAKNTELQWVESTDKSSFSSQKVVDGTTVKIYNGGYLQVECEDIEGLYPAIYKKNMGDGSTEQINAYLAAKNALYSKITATAIDGSLTLTTEKGGTVTLILDGVATQIQDRYNESQGKIIYGVLYDYIPPQDYYGYDHFDLVLHNGDLEFTVSNTVYITPDIEDFQFDSIKDKLDGVYLLSNDTWLEEVRDGYKNGDEYITKWVEYYKAQYNNHAPAGVPASSRTAMEQLAILYQVTGEKKYFDMCWEEMYPVIKDDLTTTDGTRRLTWGEDSNGFLDAAMVTYSVAFAYNYIKEDLTDIQKTQVMKALYEEGFYYFENLYNVNVLLHGNNHNLLVCGDLAVAALSAMSYEGELTVQTRDHGEQVINVQQMAAETVATAFKYLQIGLVHYAENGGFPEGPSYSIYAHRNMVSLLGTLYNLYGTDSETGLIKSFGLSEIEGIQNYVNYPLYSSSPNYESFYYAESDYSNNQPALLWYTRINEDNYNAALLSKLADQNEQYNIQTLLYYTPGLFDKVNPSEITELDQLLDEHELATFRSEFGNEMAIFTGLKGTNSDSGAFAHKNMDSGSFELYALGERFIGNFSNETYNVIVPDGYWDYDYQRWTYYKKAAQGQNTLVFNPDKNPVVQQDPNEKAPIIRFESDETSGLAVIDLSKVYKSDAVSVYRGLKLFNNRTSVMVQDEFVMRDKSTVYWSAHTEARIDIINDKLARLTINGKSVYALITSELGAFEAMPATALPGTQGDFCNLDNEGVNKLVIKLEEITSGTLNVVFVASLEEITEFGSYTPTALADWALDGGQAKQKVVVDNITFEAKAGYGYKYIFNPNQYEYVVKLADSETKVPDLSVEYDQSKYTVTVDKSNVFGKVTTVTVKDNATGAESVYKYKFVVDAITRGYENFVKAEVVNVTGHANAANLLDDKANSMVMSDKKEEIVFELAQATDITNVLIRFGAGKVNTYYYDIYASLDGVNYDCVLFGGQSSNGLGDEVYSLGKVNAKYFKIVFHGEVLENNLMVSEVKFLTNPEALVVDTPKAGCNGGCGGSIAGAMIAVVTLAGALVLARKKEEE